MNTVAAIAPGSTKINPVGLFAQVKTQLHTHLPKGAWVCERQFACLLFILLRWMKPVSPHKTETMFYDRVCSFSYSGSSFSYATPLLWYTLKWFHHTVKSSCAFSVLWELLPSNSNSQRNVWFVLYEPYKKQTPSIINQRQSTARNVPVCPSACSTLKLFRTYW